MAGRAKAFDGGKTIGAAPAGDAGAADVGAFGCAGALWLAVGAFGAAPPAAGAPPPAIAIFTPSQKQALAFRNAISVSLGLEALRGGLDTPDRVCHCVRGKETQTGVFPDGLLRQALQPGEGLL